MSISKSAFSLSKDEYEGTGKRLFIGLVIGTAILLCVLLLLIWLVPTIGFAAIHPWLPFIAGIVFGGAILGILWLSVGLVLHAYTGKPILGTSRLRGITIRLLLPIMELMGRMMRIPVAAVRRSFIKVNNELVLSSGIQCEPRQLLVLLPHCIQSSRCTHRLTYHIDNCARCGACPLKDVLNLRDTYGVQVVCPGRRGDVLDMPLRLGEVVGHMPSAAGRVGRFRDTVQDDFFRRHSGRQDGQHIAVVGKEVILSPVEYLPDGELDAVMPGIRGMIGPA